MGFCAREFWQLSAMARMALESIKEKGGLKTPNFLEIG